MKVIDTPLGQLRPIEGRRQGNQAKDLILVVLANLVGLSLER